MRTSFVSILQGRGSQPGLHIKNTWVVFTTPITQGSQLRPRYLFF
jgi:hypothetical protein